MTPQETGKLLAICAAYDNRRVDETNVLAWYRVLGDLPATACEAAVIEHYATSRDWIMPADIRRRVKREQHAIEDRGLIHQLIDPAAYRAQVAAADSAFLRKLAARTGRPAELKGVPEAEAVHDR